MSLKIIKKHTKHLNNPFPSKPKSLPFKHGTLFLNSQTTLPPHQTFPIGNDFELIWKSKNGGCVSISQKSNPTRSIWSTVPGKSFISTAMAETEVEESRGSFIIKDKNIQFICNHQTIEDIKVLKSQTEFEFQSGFLEFQSEFPVLLITGRVFGMKKNKKPLNQRFEEKDMCNYVNYFMLFDQKNSNQIGFQVKFGKPNIVKLSPRIYRGFFRKSTRTRRIRVRLFGRRRQVVTDLSSEEENVAMKDGGCGFFNRICVTYSSEKNERFFGFGEQFSHMDFKGRKVPIFVQEQGIGRGDQPITFAANLVSYR